MLWEKPFVSGEDNMVREPFLNRFSTIFSPWGRPAPLEQRAAHQPASSPRPQTGAFFQTAGGLAGPEPSEETDQEGGSSPEPPPTPAMHSLFPRLSVPERRIVHRRATPSKGLALLQ